MVTDLFEFHCRFLTQVCLFTLRFTKSWHAIISMGVVWCIQRVTLRCFVGLLPLVKVPYASSHKLFNEGVQTKTQIVEAACFIHPCCHMWPLQVHHWVVTIACVLALFAPKAIRLNRKWATESRVFELIPSCLSFFNANCFTYRLCSGVWPFHRWHLRTGPLRIFFPALIIMIPDSPAASPCPKNVMFSIDLVWIYM